MIENTADRDPMLHYLGMLGSTPAENYIYDMEAAGQRQLVNSDLLPTSIKYGSQADFEALGFVFGDVVEGDPLFRAVTVPDGWKRECSDHDMWSYVVDETGARRVAVFYKAAFYDRKAFMRLERVPEGDAA